MGNNCCQKEQNLDQSHINSLRNPHKKTLHSRNNIKSTLQQVAQSTKQIPYVRSHENHQPAQKVAILSEEKKINFYQLQKLVDKYGPWQKIDDKKLISCPVEGPYIYKNENQVYKGQYFQGQRHGLGTILLEDRQIFSGNFVFDEICGSGRYINLGKEIFEGCFNGNLELTGVGVYVNSKKGISYKGDFFKSKFEGEGILENSKGTFRGEFSEGKMNGSIVFTSKKDGSVMRLLYENGKNKGKDPNWNGEIIEEIEKKYIETENGDLDQSISSVENLEENEGSKDGKDGENEGQKMNNKLKEQ